MLSGTLSSLSKIANSFELFSLFLLLQLRDKMKRKIINVIPIFFIVAATFMFMTAAVFEVRHSHKLLNEVKETKLQTNTEPQAGINILLAVVALL